MMCLNLDTIEANVESAHTDVEAGTEQLQRAAMYQVENTLHNEIFSHVPIIPINYHIPAHSTRSSDKKF